MEVLYYSVISVVTFCQSVESVNPGGFGYSYRIGAGGYASFSLPSIVSTHAPPLEASSSTIKTHRSLDPVPIFLNNPLYQKQNKSKQVNTSEPLSLLKRLKESIVEADKNQSRSKEAVPKDEPLPQKKNDFPQSSLQFSNLNHIPDHFYQTNFGHENTNSVRIHSKTPVSLFHPSKVDPIPTHLHPANNPNPINSHSPIHLSANNPTHLRHPILTNAHHLNHIATHHSPIQPAVAPNLLAAIPPIPTAIPTLPTAIHQLHSNNLNLLKPFPPARINPTLASLKPFPPFNPHSHLHVPHVPHPSSAPVHFNPAVNQIHSPFHQQSHLQPHAPKIPQHAVHPTVSPILHNHHQPNHHFAPHVSHSHSPPTATGYHHSPPPYHPPTTPFYDPFDFQKTANRSKSTSNQVSNNIPPSPSAQIPVNPAPRLPPPPAPPAPPSPPPPLPPPSPTQFPSVLLQPSGKMTI